ncbi:MAG: enoyl-CoA hydratase/isomerase family protein [Flavobacteriales bacterium AspAUS03]
MDRSRIEVDFEDQIAEVTFFHPKANVFSFEQLMGLAVTFHHLGQDDRIKVIVLRSFGEKVFSAGAYLDELLELDNVQAGEDLFWGFAQLILSMIRCPKLIVSCIEGKVIGGAVGLVTACDHTIATSGVSVRLSELSIGIGPFVIEPIIRRRIGLAHFMALSLDPEHQRTADWCKAVGLVDEVVAGRAELENEIQNFTQRVSTYSFEAVREMKKVFWEDTAHWDELLRKRATISARLALTPYVKEALIQFKKK